MEKLVSIIIPMYNAEKDIRRCLDSILEQSYTSLEILCIDDGSEDNTVRIINDQYSNNELIHILTKKNGGVSSARNFGIEHAQGEYIAFIDSDDYIKPDYIGRLVEGISLGDISICGYYNQNRGRVKANIACDFIGSTQNFCNQYMTDFWKNGILFSPWNKLFKTSILRKYNIRFNDKISILEDIDFCLRYILHCKRVVCIEDPLYYYVASKGICSKYHLNWNEAILGVFVDILQFKAYMDYENWKEICTSAQQTLLVFFMRCIINNIELPSLYKVIEKMEELPVDYKLCSVIDRILLKSLRRNKVKLAVLECKSYLFIKVILRRKAA